MSEPKFKLGDHVLHRTAITLSGTVTEVKLNPEHPTPGWWYVIQLDNYPDQPEWSRTFHEDYLL